MKNIIMLALAPIRKNKGQSVSLFAFALITAMILNIGLALYFGIGSFFDERAEANHSAHFSGVYYSNYDSAKQGYNFIESDTRVAEFERVNAIGGAGEYIKYNDNTTGFIMLTPTDEAQKIDAPSFMGEYLPLAGDGIYIPNALYINGGYEIGDNFDLFLQGRGIQFTVAGATEEITFGTEQSSIFRFYISEEKYKELAKQFPDNGLTLLTARLFNIDELAHFQSDYQREIPQDGLFRIFNYDDAKAARTMIPVIIASICAALAMVLVIVNLIVIRFRIVNSIEEGMTNIGVLKATGYRSVQIIAANLTQYGLVTLIGSVAGALFSGILMPMIANIFESALALAWNPGFDIGISGISILVVLLSSLAISYLALRGINKLHPLTALRGGAAGYIFKKNIFPLDKPFGSLNLQLALKQIFQNKKQTAAITMIVTAITMASVAGIAVNHNISYRREAFTKAAFGELAENDIIFTLKKDENGEAFEKRLIERPEVRKVIPAHMMAMSIVPLRINNMATDMFGYIVEDTALMESDMLVEGQYPIYHNELALGVTAANEMGKRMGDTVTVWAGNVEKNYIVTGIVQNIQTDGRDALLTADGIRSLIPDFQFIEFLVYVNDGVNIKTLTESIQAEFGGIFDSVVITQEYVDNALDSMSGVFIAVAAGILAITALVVILTLYMIIKTTILRRRRELGTQKAVGFTTLQLMNQIALNMTPVILVGVTAGAAAGCFVLNPLVVVLMSGMGVAQMNLFAPFDQIIYVCAALVILSYAISILISWRIRKISAYTLVTE